MFEQSAIAALTAKAKTVTKTAALAAGLSLAAFAGLSTPASAASPNDYVGRWMNSDHDSSGITGLSITQTRGGLSIRVYGLCQNQPVCDWDPVQGSLYGLETDRWDDNTWGRNWSGFNWNRDNAWSRDADYVTATLDVGYSRKFIVMHMERGNTMTVQVFTDSRDRRGRQGYVSEIHLQKWGRMNPRDDRRDDRRDDQRDDRDQRDRDRN